MSSCGSEEQFLGLHQEVPGPLCRIREVEYSDATVLSLDVQPQATLVEHRGSPSPLAFVCRSSPASTAKPFPVWKGELWKQCMSSLYLFSGHFNCEWASDITRVKCYWYHHKKKHQGIFSCLSSKREAPPCFSTENVWVRAWTAGKDKLFLLSPDGSDLLTESDTSPSRGKFKGGLWNCSLCKEQSYFLAVSSGWKER